MKVWLAVAVALSVAACGADGEPVQPTGGAIVTLSSSGIGLGTHVGLRQGPFSVGLGLGL